MAFTARVQATMFMTPVMLNMLSTDCLVISYHKHHNRAAQGCHHCDTIITILTPAINDIQQLLAVT